MQADREKKAGEEARVQAAKKEKAQQELAAALATDDAALANMSKKDVIALIRKFASLESDLLMANARVLMSPASTKEQVVALWRQVRETVVANPTLSPQAWEAAKEQAAMEKKAAEKARMPSAKEEELASLFGPNAPRLTKAP